MALVHKYNSLYNQAKKLSKDGTMGTEELAGAIQRIAGEIDVLREKERIRYKEKMMNDEIFSGILENILNDSMCFAAIKTKKIRHEIVMCLLADFMVYLENDDTEGYSEYQFDKQEKLVPLIQTAKCFFGSEKNFIIKNPVVYKCPYDTYCKIHQFVKNSEKPDCMVFDAADFIKSD